MPSTKLLCNILGSNSVNSEDSSVLGFYSLLTGKQLLEFCRSSVFIFKVRQSKIFFQYAANYCLLYKNIPEALDCPILCHFCYIISYSATIIVLFLNLEVPFSFGFYYNYGFMWNIVASIPCKISFQLHSYLTRRYTQQRIVTPQSLVNSHSSCGS